MSEISKLITELTISLNELNKLDLSDPKGLPNDVLLEHHAKIKESQKLASNFQQLLSPIQKEFNRKRIKFLKERGRQSKQPTKAELIQELEQLRKKLESSPQKE